MKLKGNVLICSAALFLVGFTSHPSQDSQQSEVREPSPKKKECTATKDQDCEVIAQMEFLALIDFLKDMEILKSLEDDQ